MSIKQRTVIGAHAFYYPQGAAFTIPAAGTVSKTSKPGSTDPLWFDWGVSDWDIAPTHTIKDFKAPSPGVRRLTDKITTSIGMKLKGKIMEMSNPIWKLILAANNIPMTGAGGQYNPLMGDPVLRGWLQLQQFNQFDILQNTMDLYVAMVVPGDASFGENEVDISVEADVLFSTLNTGNLV